MRDGAKNGSFSQLPLAVVDPTQDFCEMIFYAASHVQVFCQMVRQNSFIFIGRAARGAKKNTSLVEWGCAKQDLNECENTSRQNDYVALELKRTDNDGFSQQKPCLHENQGTKSCDQQMDDRREKMYK